MLSVRSNDGQPVDSKLPLSHEDRRAVIALAVIWMLALALLFKPWVHGFDTVGYFSWLRSAVVDHNLDVANEFAHYGFGWWGTTTVTGYRDNPYGIGSAILWSPFYLLAHGLSLLGPRVGMDFVADGYAPAYVLAASLGSVLYAFAGVLLTYRLARRFVCAGTATVAVAASWLASPLVFYQFSHPLMSHANDYFTYALFLTAWSWAREQHKPFRYALLGAAAALSALVRTQNVILVVWPLVEIVASVVQDLREHVGRSIRDGIVHAAAFSLAWWIIFLPQLVVWRIVFGTWIPGNPYDSAGGSFDFLHPHFFGVLFSTNSGLFSWTPLLLLSVVGWAFLWRRDRRFTGLLTANFALQVCVVASWSSWNGCAAFGQRFFSNMVPAFAVGLSAVLADLRRRVPWKWLVVGCTAFIIWNALLIMRYVVEDIPRSGAVPLVQLVVGQFTVLPRYFKRIIQILATRQ